ncbi:MAG: membrane protein insertion efficiency factor YidD [Pseudomonadota bacterium]
MKKILLMCFIPLIMATLSPVMASEVNDQSPVAGDTGETNFNPGAWVVSFYRNYISPVDGDRCPSYPSCSSYSMMAIRKHGFFVGWVMTVDRLVHEGKGETRVSPMIFSNGRWKIYDPVENNDFWWYP